MARHRILLVDDEADIRFAIGSFFESHGFEIAEAETCAAALEHARTTLPDAVVIDYILPDGNALDLIPRLREIDASMSLVVLTGHASIDLAVTAVKEGADQFLTKPVELPALKLVIERLLSAGRAKRRQLARINRQGRELVDPFLGSSAIARKVAAEAARIAGAEAPVLILGETGSGKGVLARWLHAHSPRADEALVDLNCAGLSKELLDAELFGHERGAFTGAVAAKVGLLEVAHQGVLFLDEIGDMDPLVQAKLLKVLEEQRFRRLGDVRDKQVNVRLIAATHHDVPQLVQEGRFRRDLYFRISALPITMPALRERPEDIPVLAEQLLERLAADLGHRPVTLDGEALEALRSYSWPGNIRELRNVLERALLLSDATVLYRGDLRFDTVAGGGPTVAAELGDDSNLTLEELEHRHIERVMRAESGGVEAAARRLGISRSTLYQKLKEYGLSSSDFRKAASGVRKDK
jgi:DNA-binding NtrC family response regulator